MKNLTKVFAGLFALILVLSQTIASTQTASTLMNEPFDHPIGTLPAGWTVLGSGTSNWGIQNSSSAGGTAPQMSMSWNPSFIGESRLMTHTLNAGNNTALRLKLNIFLQHYGQGHNIKIGFSTDGGTSWSNFWEHTCTSDYGPVLDEHYFTVPANTDFQIGFYYSGDSWNIWGYHLDNIIVETLSANDLAGVAVSGNDFPSVGQPNDYEVTIQNLGSQTVPGSAYSVKLFREGGILLGEVPGVDIAPTSLEGVNITWIPQNAGPTSLYAFVDFPGDEFIENNTTPNLNVFVKFLVGDANCDGQVNVLDLINIANYVLLLNPEPFCFDNADVNNDGIVNVIDLINTVSIITFACGQSTVTDIDGNVYNTVLIGNHCWFKENLKTTKYRYGVPIEFPGNDNNAWLNNTTGAYAWYGNDINYKDSYGALYNWYAVNNPYKLCPEGWQVPTDADWTQLTDYVVAQGFSNSSTNPNGAGNAMKSCRQVNSPLGGNCNTTEHPRWDENSTHHGFDEFGFSALPAGYRIFNYTWIGKYGYWWSSSQTDASNAWQRMLGFEDGNISPQNSGKNYGVSVRCMFVASTANAPVGNFSANPTSGTAPLTVNFYDQSANNPTSWLWNFGDGYSSTEQNPVHTYDNAGTYTVQLYVSNGFGNDTKTITNFITVDPGTGGTGVPCPGIPTITDIDGNVYNTVLIGNQCWMKENLKTSTYRNGIPIPNVTNNNSWAALATGAYVWYDNDISYKNSYGAMYNWFATADSNGLCPAGWHVPSNDELLQLVNYTVAQGYPNNGNATNGAGNALKSCRQVNSPLGGNCNTTIHPRWNEHETHYGFDQFGFSATPGGYRNPGGVFWSVGLLGYLWSTTQEGAEASYTYFRRTNGDALWSWGNKLYGHSVRCVKDN